MGVCDLVDGLFVAAAAAIVAFVRSLLVGKFTKPHRTRSH